MNTKEDLAQTIIREFKVAQEKPWAPPREGRVGKLVFPPLLPTGGDIQLPATEKLLDAVSAYADLVAHSNEAIKTSHKKHEWFEVVRRAFGAALYNAEHGYGDRRLVPDLLSAVDGIIASEITSIRKDVDLVLGCWLFESAGTYPINVGPVSFEWRTSWLERSKKADKISPITSRRLHGQVASAKRIRPRRSFDGRKEQWIADAIGDCPAICTVRTNGLSGKLVEEKGVRAARLAMTAISLMWNRPSEGLSWMHLLYDGPFFHRCYVTFTEQGMGAGSTFSRMPRGYNQADLREGLREFQSYLDVLGQVIADYLAPHVKRRRPTLSNALFIGLWWYQQACREESNQIATTKFAASMDALAGGKGAGAILQLIAARLGCAPDKAIMPDGRTTKQVVERIYNAGRSRLIHGSSDDFAQDWSGIRVTAETLGRHILLEVCDWLAVNGEIDNLSALRSC
jgi:hypothetical protein